MYLPYFLSQILIISEFSPQTFDNYSNKYLKNT